VKAEKYSKAVATNMVIANMIGTGIFTAIGYQVMTDAIPDPFTILIIWVVGGLFSLCGAFAYSEVASCVNRSGGEYSFLSELYHPLLGFLSGWVSIIVGFSASIAALALVVGEYFLPFIGLSKTYAISLLSIEIPIQKIVALSSIILIALVHIRGVKFGGVFQNYITAFKLLIIGSIIVVPFIYFGYEPSNVSFIPTGETSNTILSSAFAGSLVWVMFSYSGWNASTYILGNLENPTKTLPFSLIFGTLAVTVIYVLLNFTFMYVASFQELEGQIDVGNVVMQKVLGNKASLIFSGVFSFALLSGLSAMMIAGPRVAEEIGKDFTLFKVLGKQNSKGNPVPAIIFLTTISSLLVIFSSFKEIVEYIGITLTIFAMLTVFGVFIIRKKRTPNVLGIKCLGYPFSPLMFIALSSWMLYYFISQDPIKIVWCLITVVPGVFIYFLSKR
jgi:basic amino acid/polyamine antiporter, APA family